MTITNNTSDPIVIDDKKILQNTTASFLDSSFLKLYVLSDIGCASIIREYGDYSITCFGKIFIKNTSNHFFINEKS